MRRARRWAAIQLLRWRRLPHPHMVMTFENGLVATFDEDGHQIPELQGRWDELRTEIMRRHPTHINPHMARQPDAPGRE